MNDEKTINQIIKKMEEKKFVVAGTGLESGYYHGDFSSGRLFMDGDDLKELIKVTLEVFKEMKK